MLRLEISWWVKFQGRSHKLFSFEDGMDDDAESDGEVEMLRQGLLSVKFSREFKQKIYKPWVRAFIVKVYGRSVGLNFIQAKLLAYGNLQVD